MFKQWEGFNKGAWSEGIDVRNFIQKNYTAYEGDKSFLVGPTEKTQKVFDKVQALIVEEIKKGIIDVSTDRVSGIDNYDAGYIDKDNEIIVGLQTDAPLKRIVNPFGGMRMVETSLKEYGFKMDDEIRSHFNSYRKTHNQGVFHAYTKETRAARSAGLLTGLPDAYGRGRIIGDYRRIALYGIDYLINEKQKDYDNIEAATVEETIRSREEVSMQIEALNAIKSMANRYGYDISSPATNAREAVQWLYFGYLAAVKENNGAAMSFGRTSTFLDIYIERDLKNGVLTESEAQELVDQLIIKLRLVRHLRTPEYNELFAGDPTWVTESIGGMGVNGKPLVTKNSFRYLQTLVNLSPAPEPNLTVLWSDRLPKGFKDFCSEISIKTDSIQYENDEVMRPMYGDDYAIACCVSAMQVGKQMQFFGARTNLAKALLYTINGGIDEKSGKVVIKGLKPITDEVLDYKSLK